MALINKSHNCPYRQTPHSNLAFAEYDNGYWCYGCNKGKFDSLDYKVNIEPSNTILNSGFENDLKEFTFNPKEFSLVVLEWLYKYFVYDDLIKKYHIGFRYDKSNNSDILLFPIINNGEIVAFQTRQFPSKRFYSKHTNKYIFVSSGLEENNGTVVLVEDFISSIRVGEFVNCIWLQGTSIRRDIIEYIINKYSHIKIWLDGDNAGRVASSAIYMTLLHSITNNNSNNAYKCQTEIILEEIKSELDPKCYSPSSMQDIIFN